MRRSMMLFILLGLACGLLVMPFSESGAENYVAGQLGVNFPGNLTSVNLVSPREPRPDHDLKTSLLYGAKLGHYFEELPWFGIETEIFHSNPVLRPQQVEPGASMSMTVWAMMFVARYPGERLQPYVGVGPGVFLSRLKSTSPVSTYAEGQSASIGLNTQVGIRYLVTTRIAVFTEWKYNHSRVSYNAFPNATYHAHNLVFGIGYHF